MTEEKVPVSPFFFPFLIGLLLVQAQSSIMLTGQCKGTMRSRFYDMPLAGPSSLIGGTGILDTYRSPEEFPLHPPGPS